MKQSDESKAAVARIHNRIDSLDEAVENLEKLALKEAHSVNMIENRIQLLEEKLKSLTSEAKDKFKSLEADVQPVKKQVAFVEVLMKVAGVITALGVIAKLLKFF